MAFIRSYAAQGDPYPRTLMRAGHLVVRSPLPRPRSGPGPSRRPATVRDYLQTHPDGFLRAQALAGDPFLGKLFKKAGKALKKVTLKGVVKGVGNIVKKVAPIASVLVPGVGGLVASGIGALAGGGGSEAAPVVEALPVAEPVAPLEPSLEEQQAMFDTWLQQYVAELRAAEQRRAYAQHFQSLPLGMTTFGGF